MKAHTVQWNTAAHLPINETGWSSAPAKETFQECDWAGDVLEVDDSTERVRRSSQRFGAFRIGVILAFAHSLLFLALFLFMCARVGAETTGKPEGYQASLKMSSYNPTTERDPFLKSGGLVKSGSTAQQPAPAVVVPASAFKLQGILYQPSSPSALVNDTLVTLNQSYVIQTLVGSVSVKVAEVSPEKVVLLAGAQSIELRLAETNSSAPKK
jgi:hypothetical protein